MKKKQIFLLISLFFIGGVSFMIFVTSAGNLLYHWSDLSIGLRIYHILALPVMGWINLYATMRIMEIFGIESPQR
jgi:hypothetical protein